MQRKSRYLVNIVIMIIAAVIFCGCSNYSKTPEKSAEKYVKKLVKESGYDIEVGEAHVRYYGKIEDAKYLYGDKVESKDAIQDFCVVKVEIKTDEKETYYEIDCVKYNDKWRPMGEHSTYYEYNETNTQETLKLD